jgi:hypothetical protein
VLHGAFTFNETEICFSKSGYPEDEVDIYVGMIDLRNEEILTGERAKPFRQECFERKERGN